jgi:hypothetical protein
MLRSACTLGLLAVLAATGQGRACTAGAEAMPRSVATCPGAAGWFAGPTARYDHAVLGDGIEATELWLAIRDPGDPTAPCALLGVTLDRTHVFEDLAPRLHDLDADGRPEVIVVRTHADLGAQLAVYAVERGALILVAATPYIGQTRRWLAPVGVADLDGDGLSEIAYVDRPHLARVLRIVRYVPAANGADLTPVAAAQGLTNHRIGEAFISGGIRDCGAGPQMVTADAEWTRILVTTLVADGTLTARAAAPFSQAALAEVMACDR